MLPCCCLSQDIFFSGFPTRAPAHLIIYSEKYNSDSVQPVSCMKQRITNGTKSLLLILLLSRMYSALLSEDVNILTLVFSHLN